MTPPDELDAAIAEAVPPDCCPCCDYYGSSVHKKCSPDAGYGIETRLRVRALVERLLNEPSERYIRRLREGADPVMEELEKQAEARGASRALLAAAVLAETRIAQSRIEGTRTAVESIPAELLRRAKAEGGGK